MYYKCTSTIGKEEMSVAISRNFSHKYVRTKSFPLSLMVEQTHKLHTLLSALARASLQPHTRTHFLPLLSGLAGVLRAERERERRRDCKCSCRERETEKGYTTCTRSLTLTHRKPAGPGARCNIKTLFRERRVFESSHLRFRETFFTT